MDCYLNISLNSLHVYCIEEDFNPYSVTLDLALLFFLLFQQGALINPWNLLRPYTAKI